MSKKKEPKTRVIYVRDNEASVLGFSSYELAQGELVKLDLKETDEQRVKIRYRRRTDTFDIIVKRKVIEEIKDALSPGAEGALQ